MPKNDETSASRTRRAHWKWAVLKTGQPFTLKADRRSSISDVRVPPLVQSHWAQGNACSSYCYNYYTPNHYVAGCGAMAVAQLLRYFEHPTQGVSEQGNTIKVDSIAQDVLLRGGDGQGGPYRWDQMTYNPGCAMNDRQRQAVGSLCSDAGIAIRSSYSNGSTGTSMANMHAAFLGTFDYSNAVWGTCGETQMGI